MTAREIEKLLKNALIYDGEMQYALYEYELEEHLDRLKSSESNMRMLIPAFAKQLSEDTLPINGVQTVRRRRRLRTSRPQ